MMKIVGKEIVKYFSKKNQRDVEGFRVYVTEVSNSPNIEGVKTDSFFVTSEVFANYFDLPLGTEIEVFYNKYGNACGCSVLGKER